MTFLVSSDRILSQNSGLRREQGSFNIELKEWGRRFSSTGTLNRSRKEKDRLVVTTNQDETIEGDLVFVGKGVTPNIRFCPEAAETNKGILVNERLQTNIENIYAAGDVTEGINPLTNQREIIANWPNACHQGKMAGLEMIGEEETFTDFIPRNVTQIFGLLIASIGSVRMAQDVESEQIEISDPQREIYSKIFLSRNEDGRSDHDWRYQ